MTIIIEWNFLEKQKFQNVELKNQTVNHLLTNMIGGGVICKNNSTFAILLISPLAINHKITCHIEKQNKNKKSVTIYKEWPRKQKDSSEKIWLGKSNQIIIILWMIDLTDRRRINQTKQQQKSLYGSKDKTTTTTTTTTLLRKRDQN